MSHHCDQNQFCSIGLGRKSEGPPNHKKDFSRFTLITVFPRQYISSYCPSTAPLSRSSRFPSRGEQQKSFCLPTDSLDWETFQGNRIKALDLLPTGFFHPLIAAGSSLKPKGALCHLHQNISLHSQHTCTALPTCLGVTKKKNGQEFSGWPYVSHGLPTRITI